MWDLDKYSFFDLYFLFILIDVDLIEYSFGTANLKS